MNLLRKIDQKIEHAYELVFSRCLAWCTQRGRGWILLLLAGLIAIMVIIIAMAVALFLLMAFVLHTTIGLDTRTSMLITSLTFVTVALAEPLYIISRKLKKQA
jgi:hypothetical protein